MTMPSFAQAQFSLPKVTTTYKVQVRYEFWRNGSAYWSTVLTTEDASEAELMYDLLLDALVDGDICDLMECAFDFIINDVRLVTERRWSYSPTPIYRKPYEHRDYSIYGF